MPLKRLYEIKSRKMRLHKITYDTYANFKFTFGITEYFYATTATLNSHVSYLKHKGVYNLKVR